MGNAVRRVALRVKTHSSKTVYTKRTGRTGRKQGSNHAGSTVRGEAIAAGVVPKARTSFCLFTQEEMTKPEYVGVNWGVCIKRIASIWKELDDTAKGAYKKKSNDEWLAQQRAMFEQGLTKVGAPHDDGGVTPPRDYPTRFGSYQVLEGRSVGRGSYGQGGGLQSRFSKMIMVRMPVVRCLCISGFRHALEIQVFFSCLPGTRILQPPGSPCRSCQVQPLWLRCVDGFYRMRRNWFAWSKLRKRFLACTTGVASPTWT